MNKLVLPLSFAAVAAFATTVERQDVPSAQNDFWDTTARVANPVRVDVATVAPSEALSELDGRFKTCCVSNSGNIEKGSSLMLILR
ncbi:MAG: hypothetical protein IKE55_08085 [Kiritimatiellae bacterium]|nr:hypothetical protein [Kiritimatiellia bacterium]